MLPDIAGTELFVIALVALIVVGPKDLPVLLRKLGQWVAKMRGMAAEFRASFDEMARQSELDELRREVEAMRAGQFTPVSQAADEARTIHADIETALQGGEVQLHPPMSHQVTPVEDAPPAAAGKPKRRRPPSKPKAQAGEVAPAPKPRAPRRKAGTPS
ncbi:MAG: Sec-independent protein translocase protein TatB [Pseudomonadota bacterium]